MGEVGLNLPIIDLSLPDRCSIAESIRQACIDYCFFYIVNHGLDKECLSRLFDESKRFFSLPLEERMKLSKKEVRGYAPLYSDKLDHSSSQTKADSRESFCIGRLDDEACNLNHWPSEELLPNWRLSIESCYRKVLKAGKSLLSLIALALNLDENYFENVGVLDKPMTFLRIIRYPGDFADCNEEILGASAHSDYGIITLLGTDGDPGLQVCRDKDQQPRVWKDVLHVEGALIINIGDMTERWTDCLFRRPFSLTPLKISWWSAWIAAAVSQMLQDFLQSVVVTTSENVSGLDMNYKCSAGSCLC